MELALKNRLYVLSCFDEPDWHIIEEGFDVFSELFGMLAFDIVVEDYH